MTTFNTGDEISAAFLNAIPRGNLEQEDLVNYPIQITAWRWADGSIPDTTGAAGNPAILMGGWGSGTGIFQGEDAQAGAKTETMFFDFPVPECYVDGETITLSVSARYNDAGTNSMGTKSIDVEAYEIAEAGTAGSDINNTAAQTLTGSMAAYSWTILPTNVGAGDMIRIYVRTVIQGDNNGAVKMELGGATVKIDLKG